MKSPLLLKEVKSKRLIHGADIANQGMTMKQLGKTIHAYPSFGFGIQQMSSDVAIENLFHGLTGTLINLLKKV